MMSASEMIEERHFPLGPSPHQRFHVSLGEESEVGELVTEFHH